MANYSESELIRSILEGQLSLYEILIRKNNAYLYRIGRSYGYGHHDVEDLMQETYISAYRNLSSFQFRSSFRTWLIKIMLSFCYHKKKRFAYQFEKPGLDEVDENELPIFSAYPGEADKKFLDMELRTVIESALLRIPMDYRLVFSLRELNELTVVETSQALGISETNVKVRLNRAKAMLRKEIEKVYTPKEIFEFNLIHCDWVVEGVMKMIRE